jgi:hypothetical protein
LVYDIHVLNILSIERSTNYELMIRNPLIITKVLNDLKGDKAAEI